MDSKDVLWIKTLILEKGTSSLKLEKFNSQLQEELILPHSVPSPVHSLIPQRLCSWSWINRRQFIVFSPSPSRLFPQLSSRYQTMTPGRARKCTGKTTDHCSNLGSLPKWMTKNQGQNYFKLEQNQAQNRAFKCRSTVLMATWETRTPAAHFHQHCFDCMILWPLPSVKFTCFPGIIFEAVTEAPVYK